MKAGLRIKQILGVAVASGAILLGACATTMPDSRTVSFSLGGSEEVPPIYTAAMGSGSVTVGDDMSVSGSFTVAGLAPTMAHIHTGKRGANGPVAVWFDKTADNTWSVRAGAKLTEAQHKAFLAGETYVNVHTAQYKAGEIRGQLQP